VDIKWPALHHGAARRRVALPTYPFERKRYWIEPQRATAVTPVMEEDGKAVLKKETHRGASHTASSTELEALLGEQLRIMKKQIEVLREVPPATHINGKARS